MWAAVLDDFMWFMGYGSVACEYLNLELGGAVAKCMESLRESGLGVVCSTDLYFEWGSVNPDDELMGWLDWTGFIDMQMSDREAFGEVFGCADGGIVSLVQCAALLRLGMVCFDIDKVVFKGYLWEDEDTADEDYNVFVREYDMVDNTLGVYYCDDCVVDPVECINRGCLCFSDSYLYGVMLFLFGTGL